LAHEITTIQLDNKVRNHIVGLPKGASKLSNGCPGSKSILEPEELCLLMGRGLDSELAAMGDVT
jgi:hypothetical protein